jgi:hypothetical protein
MAQRLSFEGIFSRFLMLLLTGITVCFLGSVTASASLIVSIQSVTAAAGSSGDAFDVELTNTDSAALAVGGFSFGIVTANPDISFTDANTSTTAPYIFGTNSLFGPDLTGPTSGQTLTASDVFIIPLSGISLNPGSTVDLGHILFDVSPFASAGSFPVDLEMFPLTSLSDPSGNTINIDSLLSGQITITGAVATPEPSLLLMLFLGAVLIVGHSLRQRKA